MDKKELYEEIDLQTEAQELEEECKNYNQIANSSLIGFEEDDLIDSSRISMD
jgi:hypothetical protein